MTTTILLIRHAAHAQLGRVLSGRVGDVPLSETGRNQALGLAARLRSDALHAVHTSRVRRARETAAVIGAAHGIAAALAEPLNEIDFGAWSGKALAELEGDPQWQKWNAQRGTVSPPGGEPMQAVQQRVLGHVRAAAAQASGAVIAMVSHADVIRAGVAGILGLPLGRILSFDIAPASITRIEAGAWGERVVSVNERGF